MYKYFVVFLLIACIGCETKPVDCRHFRTGTFMFTVGSSTYKIVRTEKEQKETNVETGEWATWDVTWQDDCTYTITIKKRSPEKPTKHPVMVVKIIKVAGDFVYFDSFGDGKQLHYSSRMEKVK